VRLHVRDVCQDELVPSRAIVMRRKTQRGTARAHSC
jgi:hypothetical protein